MRILVAAKQVATLDDDFEFANDGAGADSLYLEYELTEWNAYALEAAGSNAVASVISTHHNRHRVWTNERKLKLEQPARSTGRLLHDLLSGRLDQASAPPATAHG
jgi:hypothetical protein